MTAEMDAARAGGWPGVDLTDIAPDRADTVRLLMAATDALSALDDASADLRPEGREAMALAQVLAVAISRLTAAKISLLPVIEADGLWAVDGGKSFPTWVAHRHRLGVQAARVQAKAGRTLRDHLPLARTAVLSGQITAEHAQVLAQLAPTTEQRRAVLADPDSEVDEAFLVQQAALMGVDDFRTLTRTWAAYTDPDADDRGYVEACDREHLQVSRLYDMYEVTGQLTVEHGQALKAALRAVTPAPAAGDDRTAGQRRAQALADLARITLDHELTGKGGAVRPRINVLTDYTTFVRLRESGRVRPAQGELLASGATRERGPTRSPSVATAAMLTGGAISGGPQYEDGTPISRAELDLIACTSDIARVIFGPKSEVLDVGRAARTFTGARRAALVARDKHCRFPDCTAPPILCDGHHIDHWGRDHGETAVHRGVLLCTFHHGYVHRHGIEIEPCRDGFRFRDRHGAEIQPERDRRLHLLE